MRIPVARQLRQLRPRRQQHPHLFDQWDKLPANTVSNANTAIASAKAKAAAKPPSGPSKAGLIKEPKTDRCEPVSFSNVPQPPRQNQSLQLL